MITKTALQQMFVLFTQEHTDAHVIPVLPIWKYFL